LLNQFVFFRFAVIGVVSRQQSKVDALDQVTIGFIGERKKIREILVIPACNVQVTKV
jgi:hypothetical protein